MIKAEKKYIFNAFLVPKMQNMTTLSAQSFLELSIVLFSKNIIKNKRIKAWKGGPRGQKLRKKRKNGQK